ncbi:hypothetical protein MRX96_021425 [Rhipicephalus microplus]
MKKECVGVVQRYRWARGDISSAFVTFGGKDHVSSHSNMVSPEKQYDRPYVSLRSGAAVTMMTDDALDGFSPQLGRHPAALSAIPAGPVNVHAGNTSSKWSARNSCLDHESAEGEQQANHQRSNEDAEERAAAEAATKIQATFRAYKVRKEVRLGGSSAGGSEANLSPSRTDPAMKEPEEENSRSSPLRRRFRQVETSDGAASGRRYRSVPHTGAVAARSSLEVESHFSPVEISFFEEKRKTDARSAE